jgi:hypothetical protein
MAGHGTEAEHVDVGRRVTARMTPASRPAGTEHTSTIEEAWVLNRRSGGRGLAAMLVAVLVLAGATSVYAADSVHAASTAPAMDAAASYSVLASTTVESSGETSITGDVGTWPGTRITGFPPGHITDGATHTADQSASDARSAVASANADLLALATGAPVVSPGDLTFDVNGGPVTPGVYAFSGATSIAGTIQLGLTDSDEPDDIIVFHVPGDLSVASGTKFELIGGLHSDHVFWCVDGSADVAAGVTFVGSILASQSVTLEDGAFVRGKVVSLGDSVHLTTASVDGVTAFTSIDATDTGDTDESTDTSDTLPATGEDGPAAALPLLLALTGVAAVAGGLVLSRRSAR